MEDEELDPLRPENPCVICVKFNERVHNHAFLQLGEIMTYVCEHLKKHNLAFPKLIYDSGAKSMLFSFGGKWKIDTHLVFKLLGLVKFR